jgi:Uma2 family endonuclease
MTAIIGGPYVSLSDDDLRRISERNPGWRFERTDSGELLVSPTSTPGGAKSAEALVQLHVYSKRAGGKVYDAATGFKTPGGGVVSPDASWISASRVAEHEGEDDDGYWQVMPDVVIEVASKSDSWPAVTAKIDKFVADGSIYAIAINPRTRETYERGHCPDGLVLDIAAIVDA